MRIDCTPPVLNVMRTLCSLRGVAVVHFQSRRQTVLLVDPSQDFVHGLNSILAKRGYRTAAFASVGEAKHWLAEHQPHIIVVDGSGGTGEDLTLLSEFCQTSVTARPLIFVVSDSRDRAHVRALLANGAADVIRRPLDAELFLARLEVHLHYHHSMVQLERRNELLSRLAAFDELTRLFNRRSFLEALAASLETVGEKNSPVALLLIDVDHFKQINDQYGHQAGDEVLRHLAGRLAAPLRQDDIIGRYGGEEFCALIHNVSMDQALVVAERLRQSVGNEPFQMADRELAITVSVGVAWMPGKTFTRSEELLRCADAALYEAKRRGRNRIAIRDLESTRPGDCEVGPALERGS